MRIRPILIAAVVATALATAGCTSPSDDASPSATVTNPVITPTPTEAESDDSVTPAPDSASFASVDELKAALVAAGFSCDKFDATTGACGKDYILQVFADSAARDVAVNAEQGKTTPTAQAIGANWIVTAGSSSDITDMEAVTAKLGGYVAPQGS